MMGHLLIEVKHNIAIMTMTNPPANAISSYVLEELTESLDILEGDNEVRVILIRGGGKCFSAGADIREFTSIESGEQATYLSSRGQDLFERIENSPKPIIAVIHGVALGGGLEFALSCHIRMVSKDAKLGLPEINLGIIPGFAGTQRLTRYVGIAKATEMILTGTTISGEEAVSLGLANHAFDEEELFDRAYELATQIASKSPIAIRAILTLTYANKTVSYQRAVAREAQLFGEVFGQEDAREGITAFLEKRTPDFSRK